LKMGPLEVAGVELLPPQPMSVCAAASAAIPIARRKSLCVRIARKRRRKAKERTIPGSSSVARTMFDGVEDRTPARDAGTLTVMVTG